ncbi:MAG: NADH-quinone oxidoreductase subunit N [Phycisphaerales bacterium]|nr:NADH-quinone oxidoreductase subunit N [Phycisphaerales bacterium]
MAIELIPEIILLITAVAALLLGLAARDSVRRLVQWVSLIGLAAALAAGLGVGVPADAMGHISPLAKYMTLLTCASGILLVLNAWGMPFGNDPAQCDSHFRGETFAMMLVSLAGLSMMAKVDNLIWLFLALELVSIPTYVLVAAGRGQIASQEAGVKYFFLGALSVAIFLFGFSYLYGFAGSTNFVAIHRAFLVAQGTSGLPFVAVIGLLMVILGVSYKIAAVPLHYYAPDVYQGAATPVTSFLSFVPKAAGFVAIIVVLNLTGWNLSRGAANAVPALLAVMAVLTMTIGNVFALLQRNIKRMLAYSSVAHSGYILAALVAGPDLIHTHVITGDGITAAVFYLAAYGIMTIGVFAVLTYLQGKTDAAEDLDDIAGIASEHRLAAACMAICLFSLIGMPGTVGFLGKLFIVQADFVSGHEVLAVIVVINAAIAAAYYLRIVAAMYIRESWTPFVVRKSPALQFAGAICAALVIFFGIAPTLLINRSGDSASNILPTASAQMPKPAAHSAVVITPKSAPKLMARTRAATM